MAKYRQRVGTTSYRFSDLKTLLAKATPARAGDRLAGIAAQSAEERVAAQMTLADVPLATFLNETVVDYDTDEVTRIILDEHDAAAFAPVAHFTVGELRNWLLSYEVAQETLAALAPGLTPEMVAAVSKLMRIQDMVLVAAKTTVITRFRDTLGQRGCLATRLQPNHPTDDPKGIAAVTPKLLLVASVPPIDWNTRSTGAPWAIASIVVVTWVSTQDCVGMPKRRMSSSIMRQSGRKAARPSPAGLMPMHASPQP